MWTRIKRFRFYTLDRALRLMNKLIKNLEEVEKQDKEEIHSIEAQMNQLQMTKVEKTAELDRAARIKDRLQALLE